MKQYPKFLFVLKSIGKYKKSISEVTFVDVVDNTVSINFVDEIRVGMFRIISVLIPEEAVVRDTGVLGGKL